MAHPKKVTVDAGTQTDIVNCKCAPKPALSEQANANNSKEKKITKQASNYTVNTEILENKDDDDTGNTYQQDDVPWTTVGQARTQSLSPRSRDNKGHNQRRRGGEPPDKLLNRSQSPTKLMNKTKSTIDGRSLGATASANPQVVRKSIEFPQK